MKFGEMLDRLDSPEDCSFDGSGLIEELGLSGYACLSQHGFTSRPITVWICTDTWVGRNAVYLNGVLVAVSNQECRKCSIDWEWISQAAYDQVLIAVCNALHEEATPQIHFIDLGAEIGEPHYQLSYASQVLWHCHHKTALYQGRSVTVLGTVDGLEYPAASVKIQDQGQKRTVPLNEIRFVVPLRPPA